MASYVFNSNLISRIRLWFFKIKTLKSDPDCTPYHFTIKSTPNYLESHNKEKVACINEIFPAKITTRRFAHREIEDTYVVDDYFRVDSFTDISFSADRTSESHLSSIIINKPSMIKVIVSKAMHTFGYEASIFEIDGTSNKLVYSTSNIKKKKQEIESSDIRISIMLPAGQYSLRIRAVMKGQDYIYSTCDSVKVYVGVTPLDDLKAPALPNAVKTIPELETLIMSQEVANVEIDLQEPVNVKNETGFVSDSTQIYSAKIKNLDSNGEIGIFIEIEENVNPDMSVEVSEITATVFPDLEIGYTEDVKFELTDIPDIFTSNGKTFMYIKKLSPQKVYNIELWRSKILKLSESKSLPSNLKIRASLYSAEKFSEVKKATVEVDGKQISSPVTTWQPACGEAVLTPELLTSAFNETLQSGIQYEEIVLLNEEEKSIVTFKIDLAKMKDNDASLLISASPYSYDGENIFEEFMITTQLQGSNKKTIRSKELESDLYISQVDINKNSYNSMAVKITYSVNELAELPSYASQCNMIRLSIKYIPSSRQIEDKE